MPTLFASSTEHREKAKSLGIIKLATVTVSDTRMSETGINSQWLRAEFEVFERFAGLTRGKMVILIAHRSSTVRMAEGIAVCSLDLIPFPLQWGRSY